MYQETLFGRTVTPAERLRQYQRSLAKSQRELDRERAKLEQADKKLVADIKREAKAGHLVRDCIQPCMNERANVMGVSVECLQDHGERLGPQ